MKLETSKDTRGTQTPHLGGRDTSYTARVAQRVRNLWVLVLLAGATSACSEAFLVEVFNNAGTPVELVVQAPNGEQEVIRIAAGRSAKIWEYDLNNVTVSLEGSQQRYAFYLDEARAYTAHRWSFLPSRRLRVQLNADGRLWAVMPGIRLPVSSFGEQPPGFPIVPEAT